MDKSRVGGASGDNAGAIPSPLSATAADVQDDVLGAGPVDEDDAVLGQEAHVTELHADDPVAVTMIEEASTGTRQWC
jgi:hypothetical protein